MDNKLYQSRSNIPFYSWECITIIESDREVSLVIRNEKTMELLIKFLIYSINTINGMKNSSLKLK
jgi:hypothetical protein